MYMNTKKEIITGFYDTILMKIMINKSYIAKYCVNIANTSFRPFSLSDPVAHVRRIYINRSLRIIQNLKRKKSNFT